MTACWLKVFTSAVTPQYDCCKGLSMQRDDLTLLYPSPDLTSLTWRTLFIVIVLLPPVHAHPLSVHLFMLLKQANVAVYPPWFRTSDHLMNIARVFCNVCLSELPKTRNKSTAVHLKLYFLLKKFLSQLTYCIKQELIGGYCILTESLNPWCPFNLILTCTVCATGRKRIILSVTTTRNSSEVFQVSLWQGPLSIFSQRRERREGRGGLGIISLLTDPHLLVCYYDLGGQAGVTAGCDWTAYHVIQDSQKWYGLLLWNGSLWGTWGQWKSHFCCSVV